MVLNKLIISYSLIGNYLDLLIKNEQRIKNMLLDYEIQTKVDKLKNEQEVKSLLFSKENIHIRFNPVRVDFNYHVNKLPFNDEEAFNKAAEFFSLFGEIFPEALGSRIALVQKGFINNANDNAVKKLADNMNITPLFGECNELTLKINTPKNFESEKVNSVFSIDMGGAKNSKTGEDLKVLLVEFDINTHLENNKPRFSGSNFKNDFINLYSELLERNKTIENY